MYKKCCISKMVHLIDMDENTFKLKLTVCTLTSVIVWFWVHKKQWFTNYGGHCIRNYFHTYIKLTIKGCGEESRKERVLYFWWICFKIVFISPFWGSHFYSWRLNLCPNWNPNIVHYMEEGAIWDVEDMGSTNWLTDRCVPIGEPRNWSISNRGARQRSYLTPCCWMHTHFVVLCCS